MLKEETKKHLNKSYCSAPFQKLFKSIFTILHESEDVILQPERIELPTELVKTLDKLEEAILQNGYHKKTDYYTGKNIYHSEIYIAPEALFALNTLFGLKTLFSLTPNETVRIICKKKVMEAIDKTTFSKFLQHLDIKNNESLLWKYTQEIATLQKKYPQLKDEALQKMENFIEITETLDGVFEILEKVITVLKNRSQKDSNNLSSFETLIKKISSISEIKYQQDLIKLCLETNHVPDSIQNTIQEIQDESINTTKKNNDSLQTLLQQLSPYLNEKNIVNEQEEVIELLKNIIVKISSMLLEEVVLLQSIIKALPRLQNFMSKKDRINELYSIIDENTSIYKQILPYTNPLLSFFMLLEQLESKLLEKQNNDQIALQQIEEKIKQLKEKQIIRKEQPKNRLIQFSQAQRFKRTKNLL